MVGDTRVIDDGEFLAHCVLGADVLPACKDAKLLNVASVNESQNQNLETILLQDMERNGELMKKNKMSTAQTEDIVSANDIQDTVEPTTEPVVADKDTDDNTELVDNQDTVESIIEPSTANLTDSDVYNMLSIKLNEKFSDCVIAYYYPIEKTVLIQANSNNQNALDFTQITYATDNNSVEIVDSKNVTLMVKPTDINVYATEMQTKLDLANKSLETATASIKELQDTVVEYKVYKAQIDEIQEQQALAQKKAKQDVLTDKLKSLCGMSDDEISQNEVLQTAIASLDDTTIHSFIVENMLKNKQVVSTASTDNIQAKADINSVPTDEYRYDGSIMKDLF